MYSLQLANTFTVRVRIAPVALPSVALFYRVALYKRATVSELLFRSQKTSDSLKKPKSEFPTLGLSDIFLPQYPWVVAGVVGDHACPTPDVPQSEPQLDLQPSARP